MTSSDTAQFYDRLAPYYQLLYRDWDAAVERQGAALAALLHRYGVTPGSAVLDAACGIGTQAIGLASRGYQVTASDLSAAAIERLRSEASKRSLEISASTDDLRTLSRAPAEAFSAVVACDNSIPHLLTDAELLDCFRSCVRCLRPGGVAVFSVRDYAAVERVDPDVRPYGIRRVGPDRFLAVQVWEWEGEHYDLSLYLTTERADGECATQVIRSRYYAISVERLLSLMQQAGLHGTTRIDGALFQPVLVGIRPRKR